MDRLHTRSFNIGNVKIGGQNKVLIQSMCNIKTSKYQEVIKQILTLEKYGCDIIRVSIMDEQDAEAIKYIKKEIHIPLVGDIHFDYRLALLAMDNGIDKIRINPGNIGSKENVDKIILKAKEKNVAIRIGVNSGSLDEETLKSKTTIYRIDGEAYKDDTEAVEVLKNIHVSRSFGAFNPVKGWD